MQSSIDEYSLLSFYRYTFSLKKICDGAYDYMKLLSVRIEPFNLSFVHKGDIDALFTEAKSFY